MSGSGGGGGAIGRREVAVRCFAAEYDDASLEYSESDEERAPNYVVTPTGARVNRLFVVGVLTEVESVSDDVLRGRVVDPTGAFVVYAGQYQPDAKTFLERAEPPQFVAVTGKARTFEPDDGDRVYTSIRPESINAVDTDTRDRWTVQTAEQTIDRVAAFAAALEREERGEALREVLLASGVDPALAAGIPRAIDHYGTSGAYLAAIREMALSAAEVVAGERDEVDPLELAPDEGGPADVDLTRGVEIEAAAGASGTAAVEAPADAAGGDGGTGAGAVEATAETATESGATADSGAAEARSTAESGGPAESGEATASTTGAGTAAADEGTTSPDAEEVTGASGSTTESQAGSDGDELGDFDDFGSDEAGGEGEAEEPAPDTGSAEASGAATDEMYEMDEDERAAVEEEYGTEFSTGSEVDEPGEADIETPGPAEEEDASGEEVAADEATADEGENVSEAAPAAPEDDAAAPGDEGAVDSAPAEGQTDAEETATSVEAVDDGDGTEATVSGEDEGAEAVDLQDAAVDAMADLDDGDGADREAVIEAVADEHGADRGAVEEAIQDALMGGRCYEPEDGRLKAI